MPRRAPTSCRLQLRELTDFLFENRDQISTALMGNSFEHLQDELRRCLGIGPGEELLPEVSDGLNALADIVQIGSEKVRSHPEQLKRYASGA